MNNIGDIMFSWTEDFAANISIFLWTEKTRAPRPHKKGEKRVATVDSQENDISEEEALRIII